MCPHCHHPLCKRCDRIEHNAITVIECHKCGRMNTAASWAEEWLEFTKRLEHKLLKAAPAGRA